MKVYNWIVCYTSETNTTLYINYTVIAAMKLKDTCSLEGKMTTLDGVLKSRDITLQTNVCIVKATVFPVVMYRCEI